VLLRICPSIDRVGHNHTYTVCVCIQYFWLANRQIYGHIQCIYTGRPVHLRRNVGFWTVITVPTVITPYITVQITVGQNYGVRPYKDGATVQLDFDRNLAVWLQFWPKPISFLLFINKTQFINQESSTASEFEFPCKPLLGPSPELMQTQPSLRVVQGSIMWRQRIRGACWRWKWEVFGAERPF